MANIKFGRTFKVKKGTSLYKRMKRDRKRAKGRFFVGGGKAKLPKQMKTMGITRQTVETIYLNPGTGVAPTGWDIVDNGYAKFEIHALNQLNDYTNFTNLFAQYKICGISTKIFCSTNNTQTGSLNSVQLMLYNVPYQTGAGAISSYTEQEFLDMPSSRSAQIIRANGAPVTFYHPCNQLSLVYGSVVDNDYAIQKPRFVSTAETGTDHYSSVVRIQLLNNENLNTWTSAGSQLYLKIIRKFYLTFRKVH